MANVSVNNPKAAVTAITTGLESLSALIKDQTLQRICIIISPGFAFLMVFLYLRISRKISYEKGLKEYREMINDLETEFNTPNCSQTRKNNILIEKEKCWVKINELRTQNIKILTKD
jgi:hypothetical protein